ncbi:MAG: AmmeMemoRadiSam system protein B, partial [Deltaproteobacteria bacterium]|nr:AmmeMemoRadiSam system protein B [Deltaproteobacteria bacterium]
MFLLSRFLLMLLIFQGCKKAGEDTAKVRPPETVANDVRQEDKGEKVMENIFKSRLAGRWYPGDEKDLKEMLNGFFSAAPAQAVQPGTRLFALISPHAGLVYSGGVAAHGYKLLDAKIGKVIVIGPSHYIGMNHAAVPEFTHVE